MVIVDNETLTLLSQHQKMTSQTKNFPIFNKYSFEFKHLNVVLKFTTVVAA